MKITFDNKKVEALCIDEKAAARKLGGPTAKKLRRILTLMNSTDTASDIGIGKPHTLKGDRADELSLRLSDKNRLVMTATPPAPLREDGTIDWEKVEAVTITQIGDYHDDRK